VLIMVSQFGHCLNDLLFPVSGGRLDLDVVAVVASHPDLAWMPDNYGVPCHHIPVTPDTEPAAEAKLLALTHLALTHLAHAVRMCLWEASKTLM
jgi:formyltetrahydrofolate deformylase